MADKLGFGYSPGLTWILVRQPYPTLPNVVSIIKNGRLLGQSTLPKTTNPIVKTTKKLWLVHYVSSAHS
jgi:hypothetical protein